MSEIALIPRGYRRMGKKERCEFAIKANAEDEAKVMKDKKGVRQAAMAFEQKIKEDLQRLKGLI